MVKFYGIDNIYNVKYQHDIPLGVMMLSLMPSVFKDNYAFPKRWLDFALRTGYDLKYIDDILKTMVPWGVTNCEPIDIFKDEKHVFNILYKDRGKDGLFFDYFSGCIVNVDTWEINYNVIKKRESQNYFFSIHLELVKSLDMEGAFFDEEWAKLAWGDYYRKILIDKLYTLNLGYMTMKQNDRQRYSPFNLCRALDSDYTMCLASKGTGDNPEPIIPLKGRLDLKKIEQFTTSSIEIKLDEYLVQVPEEGPEEESKEEPSEEESFEDRWLRENMDSLGAEGLTSEQISDQTYTQSSTKVEEEDEEEESGIG
jgi:hypothetical protein